MTCIRMVQNAPFWNGEEKVQSEYVNTCEGTSGCCKFLFQKRCRVVKMAKETLFLRFLCVCLPAFVRNMKELCMYLADARFCFWLAMAWPSHFLCCSRPLKKFDVNLLIFIWWLVTDLQELVLKDLRIQYLWLLIRVIMYPMAFYVVVFPFLKTYVFQSVQACLWNYCLLSTMPCKKLLRSFQRI